MLHVKYRLIYPCFKGFVQLIRLPILIVISSDGSYKWNMELKDVRSDKLL